MSKARGHAWAASGLQKEGSGLRFRREGSTENSREECMSAVGKVGTRW